MVTPKPAQKRRPKMSTIGGKVPRELFDRVQAILAEKTRHRAAAGMPPLKQSEWLRDHLDAIVIAEEKLLGLRQRAPRSARGTYPPNDPGD